MNKKFSENCNLSSYTTIKVGGVAEYFAEPRSIKEFLQINPKRRFNFKYGSW